MAIRIPTLPAAVVPVLVGTAAAAARGHFRLPVLFAAMAAALLLQIGTNLANDLMDYRKGADTEARLGPTRVTQAGLLTPQQVQSGTITTFALAFAVGMYLVYVGGWPIFLIGCASIVAGIMYTGGPYPLGYNGLGDVFVFLFFGVIAVMGTYFVHADAVTVTSLWAALPVGCLATAILVVNNLRDIETDRIAGKRTLAVRFGARATRVQYALCLIVPYAVPAVLYAGGHTGRLFWLPYVSLPLALLLLSRVAARTRGTALNAVLKQTGVLQLVYGLLFAGSLLW